MTEYRASATEITLHPADKDAMSHTATRVQLAGTKEAGYFIQLVQEDHEIELDPEELPLLMEAARKLLEGAA